MYLLIITMRREYLSKMIEVSIFVNKIESNFKFKNSFRKMMRKPKGISQEEFETKLCYKKHNVELHEYKMHKIIYNSKVIRVPKIYSYNKETKIMIMQKIHNMTISDYYGENAADVPVHIMSMIQDEIKKLYYYGVYYPDITGYNFIMYNNNIYVIDFEHAEFFNANAKSKKNIEINPYVHDFMNGLCKWNTEFT